MTQNEIYNELKKARAGGADPSRLVSILKGAPHKGLELSYDETMAMAHFETGSILVTPQNEIISFKNSADLLKECAETLRGLLRGYVAAWRMSDMEQIETLLNKIDKAG